MQSKLYRSVRNVTETGVMVEYLSLLESYLPYIGHAVMALGYVMEQFETVDAPLPSAVVLIGHLFVLTDPRALSPEKPNVQTLNLIFLLSNILVFIYDFLTSLECEFIPHLFNEEDQS